MNKNIFQIFILIFLLCPSLIFANGLPDRDLDGIPDGDEIEIYRTDPESPDTDGDGYGDREELVGGYTPLDPRPLKLEEADFDSDGLSDRMELNFGSDLKNEDTDEDGFKDGEEIEAGYSPLSKEPILLSKRIEINLGAQELSYFLEGVRMGSFPVSSGAWNTTPRGHFRILNKHPKAWSSYGLWMPYWMAFAGDGLYGIHELPVWPSGYREGEDHLGTPVSHGCVRLGIGPAELLYNWTPIGTPIVVY